MIEYYETVLFGAGLSIGLVLLTFIVVYGTYWIIKKREAVWDRRLVRKLEKAEALNEEYYERYMELLEDEAFIDNLTYYTST